MTDQTCDGARYQGDGYDILGASPGLFEPREHGIEPHSVCSSNWAGWFAGYDIADGRLYLQTLFVGQPPRLRRTAGYSELDDLLGFGQQLLMPSVTLNGVIPEPASDGYWCYSHVGLVLEYSGLLTLGKASADGVDIALLELSFVDGALHEAREVRGR